MDGRLARVNNNVNLAKENKSRKWKQFSLNKDFLCHEIFEILKVDNMNQLWRQSHVNLHQALPESFEITDVLFDSWFHFIF